MMAEIVFISFFTQVLIFSLDSPISLQGFTFGKKGKKPMPKEDPKVLLAQLEAELTELKHQYDLFFQGGRRGEPTRERNDLESRFLVLSRRTLGSNSDNLRFSTLLGKFRSNANMWTRTVRDFEEGRLRRDKTGALTRVGIGSSTGSVSAPPPPQAPIAAQKPAQAQAPQPVDAGQGHLDRAAKELLQARQQCGLKSDPAEMEAIRKMLRSRAEEISASAGGKNVEFRVTVENGKPKIKARLS